MHTTTPRPRRLLISASLVASAALPTAIVASSVASGAAAGSAATSATSSLVKQGLRYYKGKTLTYIVPGPPGGSPDQLARVMVPLMATYLHATMNVINTTNSTQGEDEAAAAVPDGRTLGMLNLAPTAVDIDSNTPLLNFNPARVQLIGAPGPNVDIYIVRRADPIQSWQQLINSSTTVPELGIANGYTTTMQALTYMTWGFPSKIITGYNGEGALITGLLRGDGEMFLGPVSALGSLVQGNQATALAMNFPLPKASSYYSLLGGVPTITSLLKKYPPKTKTEQKVESVLSAMTLLGAFATFVQSKVPADRTAALRAAMQYAQANKAGAAKDVALGLGTGYQAGPAVKARYLNLINILKPLAPQLISAIG